LEEAFLGVIENGHTQWLNLHTELDKGYACLE